MPACNPIFTKTRLISLFPRHPAAASRVASIAAAAAVATFAVAGCGSSVNKIGDINDNPGKYMHHDVTVAGEVTRVYELPLGIVNLAAYRVNDGTGQIWVVTHNGAPNQGDKLGLRGEVEPISALGGGSMLGNLFGNVIEEHNRKFE